MSDELPEVERPFPFIVYATYVGLVVFDSSSLHTRVFRPESMPDQKLKIVRRFCFCLIWRVFFVLYLVW